MRERCGKCGLTLHRGEPADYWLGGMMFNIVLSELLAVAAVTIVVLATWPRVSWDAVWIGAIVLMVAAPFALFPLSRTVWLAFDLLFRPESGDAGHYR